MLLLPVLILAVFVFSGRKAKADDSPLPSHKHKYRSVAAASFCTYFSYTFKIEPLTISCMAASLNIPASGKQATCTPGGYVHSASLRSLAHAMRQSGLEKWPLSQKIVGRPGVKLRTSSRDKGRDWAYGSLTAHPPGSKQEGTDPSWWPRPFSLCSG